MALVAHTIVSRYTPQQREPIAQPALPGEDPWQTEHSFGAAQRLHSRPAPCFVAAVLDYDEYGMPKSDITVGPEKPKARDAAEDVSAWYRSLKRRRSRDNVKLGEPLSGSQISTYFSSHNTSPEPASAPVAHCVASRPASVNWFTSCPRTADVSVSALTQSSSKPSAFADILSRNPPPLPSEPAFKPPVFLALGPGNKGFTMLQRKGWQEGEGLGSSRIERRPREGLGIKRNTDSRQFTPNVEEHKPIIDSEYSSHEVIDLTFSESDPEEHEVIDLTLSDTQSDPDTEPDDANGFLEDPPDGPQPHGTTLLTPIATTLKADRLGIGLKAVRRSSNAKAKAVTHTSAALAAHIRSGNKMRKEKARYGRGSRGFARSKHKDERERVGMLAYMNS